MPFSELSISFIVDKAKEKEDMGGGLLLRTCRTSILRVAANYGKEISPLTGDLISLHRNLGTHRFCFGGSLFFQALNART